MMPSSLAALVVMAWSALVVPDAAPAQPPTFSLEAVAQIGPPGFRANDIVVAGSFQNVPTQLQIRFVVRQTEFADVTKWTDYCPPDCVQCATPILPPPEGQDAALTAYHRMITSTLRLALHDRQFDPVIGRPLMNGVNTLARVCHVIDTKSRVAGAYLWATHKFGTPQLGGLTRDTPKPENGFYTGCASVPRYNPDKYFYTIKAEFWSGPVRLATYTNSNGEVWTPVPR